MKESVCYLLGGCCCAGCRFCPLLSSHCCCTWSPAARMVQRLSVTWSGMRLSEDLPKTATILSGASGATGLLICRREVWSSESAPNSALERSTTIQSFTGTGHTHSSGGKASTKGPRYYSRRRLATNGLGGIRTEGILNGPHRTALWATWRLLAA